MTGLPLANVGEFEKIMGRAEQCPFGSNIIETSEEKLPEASGLFDLTNDWFDDLFS
jgi:hypothetical protein